ncbi:acetyl-CoA carboxylase biotin carboxyl carrier protein [Belliella aquatica]|uniref:Biotin carboxyl carrier protein of acetyl-CoA carboxylase n=1 Tax=Belliella aquatica TaxID=1323734 RepID=A0ABQ1MB12_9BACT|nr:acetyl-CoA carboxylase biotin carboxyl carrier protein [Belliella aquatica]MCH7406270.1 acetyl-CoA carboxylase biotin carboxyl carrier protein [Belliella aquatica]GGC37483.1 acetyl-CoA carboxylase, biotin carboxyl carrier protein [Belliella aquatica]
MKAKEIQDLIDFISNSGLAEVKIKTGEFELSIKKNSEVQVVSSTPSAPAPAAAAPAPVAAPAVVPASAPAAKDDTSKYLEIKSPMIGTFYRSPNPESDNFVNVGDDVKAGQTVCIIEAMKLFNEIESEISGKIVKVLVDNATPVEYDQPLFLVDPAG